MNYRHKQTGFVTIIIFGLAFFVVVDLLVLGIIFFNDLLSAYWMALVIVLMILIAAAGILFSSLTIMIDKARLSWHFAFGFWKKSVNLADIASCAIVRNRWFYGWGIRYTGRGWLYTVSGLNAVEIRLQDGRLFRLGTDEPEKLLAALEGAKAALA